jgi:hypothetical protein
MPSARAYDAVVAGAERGFALAVFVFGPNTDLSSIAQQTDGECLEGLIEELERAFSMRKPAITDKSGRRRVPQLFIPDRLTVTELADILDSGEWPESWTRPGKFYCWGRLPRPGRADQ